MALPLSAVRVHAADLPANVICSRRNRAWLLITAPVRRWHSKQWHMEMRAGSPSMVRLSSPHLQLARRLVMECSYLSARRTLQQVRMRELKQGAALQKNASLAMARRAPPRAKHLRAFARMPPDEEYRQ